MQAATGRVLPPFPVAADLAPVALARCGLLPGLVSLVFGAVIAARRLTGAAPVPPGPGAVLLSCAVGLMLVWMADLVSRRPSAARTVGPWLARLGLCASLAAVALPPRFSSPADGVAVVIATACAAVALRRGAAAWPRDGVRRSRASLEAASSRSGGVSSDVAIIHDALSTGFPPGVAAGTAVDAGQTEPGCLVQRFERLALPDGSECVRGRLHVLVPAGARLGAGHVGFCPPLSSAPTVQVSTDYDAVEAIVTAAEVLPWGARIECRLDEPAEEAIRVPVDLSARTPS